MIDTDQKAIFQPFQVRPLDTVALQDNGRLVIPVDPISLYNPICKRKRLIDARNRIVQDDLRIFAEQAQDLAASQCGTDRVPVRTSMRGQYESVRCSMCWSTSFSICLSSSVAGLAGASFLRSIQELVNPGFIVM